MAQTPAKLFFSDTSGAVGAISFDLILSERHSFDSDITERAVEEGTPISDHIQQRLRSGSLEGLVSNYSISRAGPLPPSLQKKLDAGVRVSGADIPLVDLPQNAALDAYEVFRSLWEARELVEVVTTVDRYENVAVTSVETGRDERTGDALTFRVTFKQVRVVKLQQVEMSATVAPLKPGKSPTVRGDQDAKQASVTTDQGRHTTQEMTFDEVAV